MAVALEALIARHGVHDVVLGERSVVISARARRWGRIRFRRGSSTPSTHERSLFLEAAVAARLVQGLQPARGRDRDGWLVNRELVLIGSAVEARRQAWPVEEGSRGSRAVAVRRSGTKASASTRQARAAPVACSEAARPCRTTPHPTPPTQPPDPGREAHSSADHRAPAPCQLSAPGVGPS